MSAGEIGYDYRNAGDEPGLPIRARIRVKPSAALAERILQFIEEPSTREQLGRKGLFLYSNYSRFVHRRIVGGALMPEDELMASEFRRVEEVNTKQMPLRRYAYVGEQKSNGPTESMLVIGLAAKLGDLAVNLMKNSPHVDAASIMQNTYDSLPVHIGFPNSIVVTGESRIAAEENLARLVLGRATLELPGNDRPGLSPNIQAHVTDMYLKIPPAPPPHALNR